MKRYFTISHVALGLAAVTMATGLVASANAAVYSAADDFSIANGNLDGPWAYGEGTPGHDFTPFVTTLSGGAFGSDDFKFWQSTTPQYGVPMVGKTVGQTPFAVSTLLVLPGVLLVHPGVKSDVIVQWTAPKSGKYTYRGSFALLDESPSGVVGKVFKNGVQLFKVVLTGPGANQGRKTAGQSKQFSGTVTVSQGDHLSFAVNNDGNVFYDSTGLTATISSVP